MKILMLSKARAEDLDALCRLEEEGFTQGRWSRQSWAAELDGPGRFVVVARSHGYVIGCATFSYVDDTAELLRVIVERDSRGEGIGEELIEQGMMWGRERGTRRMMLEVEGSNYAALSLYRRMGFREVTRRESYYGSGRAALVMERGL